MKALTPAHKENDIEDQNQFKGVRESDPHFPVAAKMNSQRKSRFSKPCFFAVFLVVFILGVYTIHHRPNISDSLSDKQHADWLKRMTEGRDLQNDSVDYRDAERHGEVEAIKPTEAGPSRVSMILPVDIPEDLHKAQTPSVPLQYLSREVGNEGNTSENMAVENSYENAHKLIEMKLKQEGIDEAPARRDDYEEAVVREDYDDDRDLSASKDTNKVNDEQYIKNETGTATATELEQKPDQVSSYTKINDTEYVKPQYVGDNTVMSGNVKMQLEQANYVKLDSSENIKPTVRTGYVGDSKVPSDNIGMNNNPVVSQQIPETNKGTGYGSVLSDTNVPVPNFNPQIDIYKDKLILSQTYTNNYDKTEKNIGHPFLDFVMKKVFPTQESTTMQQLTLPGLIESRMPLHKALKDMHDIINYGSAASNEENNRPLNADENRNHLYDVNAQQNMFSNLVMQVNRHAEPVTGTKRMRPLYKSRIEYPEYLTPIDWKRSFEHVKTPIFECVPMKTLNSYIRICVHPPEVKSKVSSSLKSEASWEYNALMDVQRALLENKDAILIDIGASFGVFSLAAAALNRNVIAVEPFPSHIQVFKQSVALNGFSEHITLFQAVISDTRGKVLIKPLDDDVNNVYIQTVEDNEQSTNYTLIVNTVTLDDIEKVSPCRIAVLKIDIPGFMKKALSYSHFFFKYIYVTHVFMHWDTKDSELCRFIVRFFVERGYKPYGDLYGSNQLVLQDAAFWTNDIVIWKL